MPRFVLTAFLLSALPAGPATAGSYAPGDQIESFSLEDQHGTAHAVDDRVRVILFSRDMDGGELIKQALAERDPGLLERISAVYVVDISGMPSLIARMFALPSMRKRPYSMLLDRKGDLTASLPGAEGQASLIVLEDLTVVRVDHFVSSEALADAITKLSEGT